ncbi:hypothetical protein VNO78_01392 [Psophocarpus tetragonolobus]|uniref:Uncharacterized protein n=1 Tax=Psophocarpus tetragonolobus TaxID=3891 RepID=A0AAN9T1N7_PSOTE
MWASLGAPATWWNHLSPGFVNFPLSQTRGFQLVGCISPSKATIAKKSNPRVDESLESNGRSRKSNGRLNGAHTLAHGFHFLLIRVPPCSFNSQPSSSLPCSLYKYVTPHPLPLPLPLPHFFIRISILKHMEHFNNDDLDYVLDDDYDFDTTSDIVPQPISDVDSQDSDFEDDFQTSNANAKTDTTALEARNGKDIQGIPWERLNYSREKYRETRLKQYKNYENLSRSRHHLHKECLKVQKGKTFYDFHFNTRLVKSTIVHFQGVHTWLRVI